MCDCKGADDAGRQLTREELPQLRLACDAKEQPLKQYDILVLGTKSRGTGELTAGLNALPHLRGNAVYLMYGGTDDQAGARDEVREIVGEPKVTEVELDDPWQWETKGVGYRPLVAITPGTRPILILAPHSFSNREPTFTAPLPPGSALASWSPLGFPNEDHHKGFLAGMVPRGERMGYGSLRSLTGAETIAGPLINAPPLVLPYDIQRAASPHELLVKDAIDAVSSRPGSRIACIYGHGTNTNATAVLTRLLQVCVAGATAERWAIVVIVHHKLDEERDDASLSRARHVREALLTVRGAGWRERFLKGEGENAGSYISDSKHIQVFHMHRLKKACMDWLFSTADLPIAEGANTVHQLIAAGRPFLRTTKEEDEYLGSATAAIEHWADVEDSSALRRFKAASLWLSTGAQEGEDVVRSLLFTLEDRPELDTFSIKLAQEIRAAKNNPLELLVDYLQRGEKAEEPPREEEHREISFANPRD